MERYVEKISHRRGRRFRSGILWILGLALTMTGCGSPQPGDVLVGMPIQTLEQAGTLLKELNQVHYHNFHSEVIEESTCTEHGKGVDICEECGYTQEYILPLKEHQAGEWKTELQATETKEGLRTLHCSVCGIELASEKITVIPHEHNYVAVSEESPGCTDSGSRGYSCTVCDSSYKETTEPKGHEYGEEMVQAATCEKEGYTYKICRICGQKTETGKINRLGHNYGEWITTQEAGCTESGTQIRTCVNCKTEETRVIPAAGHKSESYQTVLAPDCTTAGREEAVCDVCGENIEREIPALGHDFVEGDVTDSTCTDEGVANYTCSRCGYKEQRVISAKGHSAGPWIIDTAPACETTGSRHKDCTVCNATIETETIAALGHSYVSTVTAPTCTAQGYTTKVCSTCNKTEITDYVNAAGHKDSQWEIVTPATCIAEGKMHKICTVCGIERENQIIEKLPHSFTTYETTKEATEDAEGEKTAHCDTEGCDAVDTVPIPRLPHIHSYDTLVEEAAAECETDGYTKKQCRCGEVLTTTIPKLGHDYQVTDHQDAACEADGYDKYTCNNCGKEYSTPIAKTGHTPGDWVTIREATDEKTGLKVRYCTICNKVLAEEEIAMLPHVHAWGDAVDSQPATCTTDGYELYRCRCGEENRVTIAATNHKNAEWKVTKEATYTEMGLEEKICPDCKAVIETKNIPVKPHEHQYETIKNQPATCTEAGEIIETCRLCGATNSIISEPAGHKESGIIVDKTATCETGGETHTECIVCHTVMTTAVTPAAGHTEGDWIVDSEASCEADGKKHTSCTICGKTVSEETINATGHNMGDWSVTSAAGCESDGTEERSCQNNCGHSESRTIPATGHNYGGWIVDEEPTEDTPGHRYKECSGCGGRIEEEIEVLPPHTHNYVETERVDSTCAAEGHVTYRCEECGDEYTTPINKKDHTPGEWQVTVPATEEAEGSEVQNCTVCGAQVNFRVIDKLEHTHKYTASHKDPTCTEDGYDKSECACGDSTTTVIPATGHKYGEAVIEEPTCTEAGKSTITCEVCGNKEETTIDAIGHNMKENSRKEPTCTMAGERVLICSNGCGKTETETIPQLAHNYQVTNIIAPTCTNDGYTLETCANCSDTRQTNPVDALGHDEGEWVTTREEDLGVDGIKELQCTRCRHVLDNGTIPMLTEKEVTVHGKTFVDRVYFVEYNGKTETIIGHFDDDAAAELTQIINDYRTSTIDEVTSNPFSALLPSGSETEAFMEIRAVEIAVLFSHDRPNGKNAVLDYDYIYGENIAKGYANAQACFEGWKNSDGHNKNMLRNTYGPYSHGCVKVFSKCLGNGSYYNYYAHGFNYDDR